MDPPGSVASDPIVIADDDDDADLQAALAMSLQDHHHSPAAAALHGSTSSFSSANDKDDALHQALTLSLTPQSISAPPKVLRNYQTNNNNNNSNDSSDDEDEKTLQAALALSLQDKEITTSTTTSTNPDNSTSPQTKHKQKEQTTTMTTTPPPAPLPPLMELDPKAIDECYQTEEPYDLTAFHKLMWDQATTTENDKNRWLEQGMDIRETQQPMPDTAASASTTTTTTIDARLTQLAQSHLPWGLIQHHGGPCGVLAAVQAEILRILLWTTTTTTTTTTTSSSSSCADSASQSTPWLEALARAVGTILARAARAPRPSSSSTGTSPPAASEEVRLVLPRSAGDDKDAAATTPGTSFCVYTIPSSLRSSLRTTTSSAKRQKMDDSEEERLAQTVAAFLLHSSTSSSSDDNNNNKQSLAAPIQQFRCAGGVMLLVMSLVASRGGNTVLQEEFDDPAGTRLTAQFGHCGQELMNLLLTGQAVSNVFDNTLKPSGDMICRGISKRPAIGYLSQLESLRYCQVGSFYKSPRYPIWVVGSTSHFTVLFGPMAALQESQSDILLERCRRAFKSVEGGDENGFIATDQLGKVMNSLGLLHQEDPSNLSLLAATLEVNGAGIILWDDFWKTASRLLTGASLETVLAAKADEPPALMPALDACSTPSTSSTPAVESDEEMARRLANEWGWEDGNSVGAVTGGDSPINLPSDDDDDAKPPAVGPVEEEDAKPAAAQKSFDFETFGNSFPMYHYNGLRGGVLTPFQVTRLSAEEAVGASIALNRNGPSSSGHSGSGDLEDVIRTKWPSCAVNWMGQSPPYID